ncbi:hypothetical protein [Streptomyces pseudogriseolus]|uniref:hypothetical protein n=1 Tax=Streptomyces pseudogriseolus TaxID=36817 RepID=UPI003FA293C0
MPHRALAALAFVVSTGVVLTGCGGGDSGADAGPDAAGQPDAASAAPAAPSPFGVERPEITLPGSFRIAFRDWTSDDPAEQAVLNDGKEELRSGYEAITSGDPDSQTLGFYTTDQGVPQAQDWVRSYTDKNLTVVGHLAVYDPEVRLAADGGNAVLTYCTDVSKASSKNLGTGEVQGNPPGMHPEVFYSVAMTKNEQGVWQTVTVHSERGACGS